MPKIRVARARTTKNEVAFDLGPSLFNIYICDFFFETSDIDIANYPDDNTRYACSLDLDTLKLQKNTERTFRWFQNDNLISNAKKVI